MVPPNYIPDQNRFNLAGPPDWFRRALWAFDPSLVIVPSRQGFYYRLAQRRKLTLPIKMTQDLLFRESDTRMLARYGLVPVTTILATVNWANPLIFEELRRRAPWRMGGAARYTALVEAQDRAEEQARQRLVEEPLTERAKDAWQLYRKKIGLQTHGFSLTRG